MEGIGNEHSFVTGLVKLDLIHYFSLPGENVHCLGPSSLEKVP